MRALITGITGFAGSHLAEWLLGRDAEVTGTVRPRSRLDNIAHLQGRVSLEECDITDAAAMIRTVERAAPTRIFHLAAQSYVPYSWDAPEATLQANAIGTLNVLEAALAWWREQSELRVLVAGSSEEYGLVAPEETPIAEENPLRPLSPYGVSKITTDMLGYQYHASYGLHVVRTRAFNHTGPRRGEVFVTSSFARQVAEAALGRRTEIRHGNLEAVRDFTDVRDTVRAYVTALEDGEAGAVYNVASGEGRKIGDVLDMLLGIGQVDVPTEEDPDRMRPSDVPLLIGDASRLTERTGWTPQIPFSQTMGDLYDWWKERIDGRCN